MTGTDGGTALPLVEFNDLERLQALTGVYCTDARVDSAFRDITALADDGNGVRRVVVCLHQQHLQWFGPLTPPVAMPVAMPFLSRMMRGTDVAAQAVVTRRPIIVLDASNDARMGHRPIALAGHRWQMCVALPLRSADGLPIGALMMLGERRVDAIPASLLQIVHRMGEAVRQRFQLTRSRAYVDIASSLLNQRRFIEDAHARCLPGGEALVPWWVVTVQALDGDAAQRLLGEGKGAEISPLLGTMARHVLITAQAQSPVYRLSACHFAFFTRLTSPDAAMQLTATLERGLRKMAVDALGRITVIAVPIDRYGPLRRLIPGLLSAATGATEGAIVPGALAAASDANATAAKATLAEATANGAAAVSSQASAALFADRATDTDSLQLSGQAMSCAPRFSLNGGHCVGFDVQWAGMWPLPSAPLTEVVRLYLEWRAGPHRVSAALVQEFRLDLSFGDDVLLQPGFAEWLHGCIKDGEFVLTPTSRPLHAPLRPLAVTLPAHMLRTAFVATEQLIRTLATHGVSVIVTEFGVGFDSLVWLPALAIRGVRLDPRMLALLCKDTQHIDIARRLSSLAHSLGAKVIAGDLNTSESLSAARALNCDEGSGLALTEQALNGSALINHSLAAVSTPPAETETQAAALGKSLLLAFIRRFTSVLSPIVAPVSRSALSSADVGDPTDAPAPSDRSSLSARRFSTPFPPVSPQRPSK